MAAELKVYNTTYVETPVALLKKGDDIYIEHQRKGVEKLGKFDGLDGQWVQFWDKNFNHMRVPLKTKVFVVKEHDLSQADIWR